MTVWLTKIWMVGGYHHVRCSRELREKLECRPQAPETDGYRTRHVPDDASVYVNGGDEGGKGARREAVKDMQYNVGAGPSDPPRESLGSVREQTRALYAFTIA